MIKRLKYILMWIRTHYWCIENDPHNYNKHLKELKLKWYPEKTEEDN